jgi:hypothetical protein
MLDYIRDDFNSAIDLDLYALEHDLYDDTALSFEEENGAEANEEKQFDVEVERSKKRVSEEEPYTAY